LLVQRGGFCRRFRLFDEEAAATAATGNIARGRFVPGQSYKGGVFRNDPSAIDKAIDEMGEDCALILMDLRFCEGEPDENGLSHDVTLFGLNWLENHKEACRIPVVAVTAEKSKEVIARVRACGAYLHRYSSGASDLVHHVLREERGTAEQRRNMMGIPFDFVAQSPAMMRMLQDVYDAGNDPRYPTLLLLGGTGSGKSELAKLIHELSGRQLTSPRSGEWQRLDCSLLTRELAQSQLFGHYKGAFTGGDATVKGAFQRANNGTLFLDEVGKLPDSVQPILYRAMEGPTSRRVATPLGSRKEGDETLDGEFNVRLIFATNEPTKKLDRPFLGRIQRTIRVPELWDRQEDILPLANLFLARLSVDVSSDDRAKNDDRINVDKKAADKDNAEIKRILMHEGRPRLRLDEHAEEFLLQQFSVRDEHDRNIRMLEALLAEAARGKGRINLIRRSDLEAAWRGTDAKFKYAGSERRNEPPSEVTSDGTVQNGLRTSGLAGGRAAQRLYEAAESSAGLVGLTVAEQRAIAGALYGKSFNLIGAVAAFAFLNCLDAKSAGIYLTGETINSGEAQGILQRLLKMHPQVAARVRALVPELSGRDKESDDGKAVLARLLDEAEEEFERRQGTGPPKKGRPATESNK
jgi:MoxR-like ATPase